MKKVLIIEDELAYMKLIHEQLHINRYEVLEAKDGKRGLELAKAEHPDLILLDVRMPVMDGMAVLNELRKDAYGRSAKVIILTNFDPDDKILRSVLVDRPTYYLMKSDIQLADLMTKIKDLLA